MFTGIVQQLGRVRSFDSAVLAIELSEALGSVEIGESVAINGVCLTVVKEDGNTLSFDLSPETVDVTNFSDVKPGDVVNIERAMALGARLGGHIVQGHVDEVGELVSITHEGDAHVFRFRIKQPRYIIQKGSVTINGISLTVVDPQENEFNCWIIPHTLEHTNLSSLSVGSKVNIEYDLIAKYVEKLVAPYQGVAR